jgi:hypothetical protein
MAGRRCRGHQLRRCEPEPFHGRRCSQHGWLLRTPGVGRPAAVRVRGQRIRDLGTYAVRLGCRRRPATGHRVRRRRR